VVALLEQGDELIGIYGGNTTMVEYEIISTSISFPLLHGYAETSLMWKPFFAKRFTVM